MDGVDAAEVLTDGKSVLDLGKVAFRPFNREERRLIQSALGKWRGGTVEACARVIEEAHIELLAEFDRTALVGFHGQTLVHEPHNQRSMQVGNGQIVADAVGLPVVWDFRTSDLRNMGQGAPLAPFYHFAIAMRERVSSPVALLNIGGVSNLTWIDTRFGKPEASGALAAFDCGPGNCVIDDLVKTRLGQPRDENGGLARRGRPSSRIVRQFKSDRYFARSGPKSADRNRFSYLLELVDELELADAAATVTRCVSSAIAAAVGLLPSVPTEIVVCGGGRHNATLLEFLNEEVDCSVTKIESWGYDGDMLEAQAFAFLAVRSCRGLPLSSPGTTGCRSPTLGGRTSLPRQAAPAI